MFMEETTLLEVMQTNLLFNPFNIPDEKLEGMRCFFMKKDILKKVTEIVHIVLHDSIDSSIVSALMSVLVKTLSQEIEHIGNSSLIDMTVLIEFIFNSILESDIFWVVDRPMIDVSIQSSFELLEFEKKTWTKQRESCYGFFSYFW
jgi:hypothetical protein